MPGKLKLTKRAAICLEDNGASVVLHLSPKQPALGVEVLALPEPSPAVDARLSPPARLHFAAKGHVASVRDQWDSDVLARRAAELAGQTVLERRQLANESLRLGWLDVFETIELTPSEKAWRLAHDSACDAKLDQLMEALAELPMTGYPNRVQLLLPHLAAIRERPDRWESLLQQWADAGVPDATHLRAVLSPEWGVASVGALALLPDEERALWVEAVADLESMPTSEPIVETSGWWSAASVWGRGACGTNVDQWFGRVANLELALLDDLIDEGTLTQAAKLDLANEASRQYLQGRLDPASLGDDEVVQIGHDSERARRAFLQHEGGLLESLDPTDEVIHYRELLALIEGRPFDRERLHAETALVIDLTDRARAALLEGATTSLPAPLVRDATVWPLFADLAQQGHLQPDPEVRAGAVDFSQWCDLQRLVGVIWEHRWSDAVALGNALIDSTTEEQVQDEALNLTAFALSQLGQDHEALELLERALSGSYTESLLINTSLVASRVSPEVAARHLARVVDEAPTPALRASALRRAITVWNESAEGAPFPPELISALEIVLKGECALDDYIAFASLAASAAPSVARQLPDPGGDRTGPHRLMTARARFYSDDSFTLLDLGDAFVELTRQYGRPDWFDDDWLPFREYIRSSVFVDFGTAIGSAMVIDRVCLGAPDLFTPRDRMVLLAQAGAHLAVSFAEDSITLNADAFAKFFFVPIEQFLSERHVFDPGEVGFVGDNFHRTLFIATIHYLEVSRSQIADAYNELVERLRWDAQNRFAILNRMGAVLSDASECQAFGDRALDRLKRLGTEGEGAQGRIDVLSSEIGEWRSETVRLRANL